MSLSYDLIAHLTNFSLRNLSQIYCISKMGGSKPQWMTSRSLGFYGIWAREWNDFIEGLYRARVYLNEEADTICWARNAQDGEVSAKALYKHIFGELARPHITWWCKVLWKWNTPRKIVVFIWLCLRNKLLTWDNLCNRGWGGPNWCILCREVEVTIHHLFVSCKIKYYD